MIPNSSENKLQEDVIDLLISMGYIFIPRDGEKRDKYKNYKTIGEYRSSTSQVVLKDILIDKLNELNGFEYKKHQYKFSSKNISDAIDDIDIPLHEGLATANQKISDQLILGNSYSEELVDGVKKSFSLNYIDFKSPYKNSFHFSEEFIVDRAIQSQKEKTRRPDIVLFINGIPFGVIELKSSSENTSQGISQMIRNQGDKEIAKLFKYTQITMAGNNHSPKYATTKTPERFYAIWNEENQKALKKLIKDRSPSKLDSTILGLFAKERVCEFISSFIIFDAKIKKIARYQQFFTIKNIIKSINSFDTTGRRSGGLIWHTQGSGKSLTMAMLTQMIRKTIDKSKVIVVTDRKDLDNQICETFKNSEIKAQKAKNAKHLIKLIDDGVSVITSVINKFETVRKEKVKLEDPNVFVLVDESHRTQSGELHKAMKKVFPDACYIGFTGTPLMKEEKNSFDKFAGEIEGTRYTIDQAVKDKAVLPLLYEGRLVDQWVNDDKGLERRFDLISKHLSQEQKLDLKKKWVNFQHIASTERRLEIIMCDINDHFISNVEKPFKAMLATSSKYEAIRYHQLFKESGDIKTAFVISAPDTREGHKEVNDDENKEFILKEWNKIIELYGSEDKYNEKIQSKFVDSEEIDLLIVVDKLLTGFDAPKAKVLYVDKLLKEHTLLQAIARVNRLYEGKEFGYIIDYRGLLGDLDKALSDYSESGLDKFKKDDLKSAVFDIKDEIARLKTYYSHLEELFKEIKLKDDSESYEEFLDTKEKREEFYEYLSYYARALKLSLSSDKFEELFDETQITLFKSKMRFYAKLRKAVKIRYHESVDFKEYEQQMQKLLDTFISAGEMNTLTQLVNIFDEAFDKECERIVGENARADTILSATAAMIKEKRESNPAYYDKLAKRINEIIQEYKDKRLSQKEKLKAAKDIKDDLLNKDKKDKNNYPKMIQEDKLSISLYDNIKDELQKMIKPKDGVISDKKAFYDKGNEVSKVVLKISQIFKESSKKPDWINNTDVTNTIEGEVSDILWDLEDKYKTRFDDVDEIVAKVRSIGISNYK